MWDDGGRWQRDTMRWWVHAPGSNAVVQALSSHQRTGCRAKRSTLTYDPCVFETRVQWAARALYLCVWFSSQRPERKPFASKSKASTILPRSVFFLSDTKRCAREVRKIRKQKLFKKNMLDIFDKIEKKWAQEIRKIIKNNCSGKNRRKKWVREVSVCFSCFPRTVSVSCFLGDRCFRILWRFVFFCAFLLVVKTWQQHRY